MITGILMALQPMEVSISNQNRRRMKRRFKMRLSNKQMADVMYAIIMTRSKLTSSLSMCRGYTRKQNAYNMVDVMIEIDSDAEKEFLQLSGVKFIEHEKPQLR